MAAILCFFRRRGPQGTQRAVDAREEREEHRRCGLLRQTADQGAYGDLRERSSAAVCLQRLREKLQMAGQPEEASTRRVWEQGEEVLLPRLR